MTYSELVDIAGEEHASFFTHVCKAIPKEKLHLPSPQFIDTIYSASNRNIQTLRNLALMFNTGCIGGESTTSRTRSTSRRTNPGSGWTGTATASRCARRAIAPH